MRSGKFILTYATFKEKRAEIEKSLQALKLKDYEIRNSELILEEVFMRLRRGKEDFSCNVEIRSGMSDS